MDLILKPIRIATSRPAQKTYLNTFLFFTTSTILLGLACIAYVLFYFNYIPQVGVERVVHLQYGDGPYPYGLVPLTSTLVSSQPYDLTLTLHLPRSPHNLAAGNFMLSLTLLSPSFKPFLSSSTLPSVDQLSPLESIAQKDILLISRRPAILTYTSRLVSLSQRIFALPLYILGLRSESETLTVPMAEGTSFDRGWRNVPAWAVVEIQAVHKVQVYDVRVQITARFGGLRWLMYNHRIIAFVTLTTAFWLTEVVFAGLGWFIFSTMAAGKQKIAEGEIKGEETDGSLTATGIKAEKEGDSDDEPDLSDTPRTFPTYGRQLPLRYTPKIKVEDDSEEYGIDDMPPQGLGVEADDEDDEGGFGGPRTDSGLGTSYSEAGGRSNVQRRRSRGGRESGGRV